MSSARAVSAAVPAWPTVAAALIAFAAFSIANGMPPVMLLLAIGLLAVYIIPVRITRATLAAWVARAVLFAVVIAVNYDHQPMLMDTLMSAAGMNFLGPILAAELVLRAFHRPSNARQMLYLSALILLFGCVTPDQRVGLFLVPPYFLCVIFALRSDRKRAVQARQAARIVPLAAAVGLAFLIGGIAHWSFRQYRQEISAWGSAVMGDPGSRVSAAQITGIDKQPSLGPTFGGKGSAERLLRIAGGLPDPHLHGMSFDRYSNGSWLPTMEARRFVEASRDDLGGSTQGARIQITRFVNDDGMVSAPLSCAGLVFASRAMPRWAADGSGPVVVSSEAPLTYAVVESDDSAHQGPLCAPLTSIERARCLEVPGTVDPRVRALAVKTAGGLPTPAAKIAAVKSYLLQNNAYSLRTNPGPGDPVSNFILQHKAAHCEFFASAAAILLRCVGVPTRYAIGYYAHEQEGPGVIVVRGQDAHAWAESWVDGTGWVIVDATPSDGRPDQTAKMSLWWKLRDRWQDFTLAVQSAVGALTGMRLVALLVGLVAVLLIGTGLRAWRARHAPPDAAFAYTASQVDLADLARRYELWLASREIPCAPNETWRENLERVGPDWPDLDSAVPVESALEFLSAYNRARFGTDSDTEAREQAAAALSRLETHHDS